MKKRDLAIRIVGEPVLLGVKKNVKGWKKGDKVKVFQYRGFKIYLGPGGKLDKSNPNPLVCDADKINKSEEDEEILEDFDHCWYHDLHCDNSHIWNMGCSEEELLKEMVRTIDAFWKAKREKVNDGSHGITSRLRTMADK